MLSNYIKTALRYLSKNKLSSFINIFGLSIAIGCSIVAYLYVHSNVTKNSHHENGASIFLVEPLAVRNGNSETWGYSPNPLGPALEADFPQIERVVRIQYSGGRVRYENVMLDDALGFADPGFFEMFTFPLKYGSPDALADPDAVIMSSEAAARYFGEENPVGRRISVTWGEEVESFTVQGVAEPFPANAAFNFSVLMRFDSQLRLGEERLDEWNDFTRATFIQVNNPEDIDVITSQMDRYVPLSVDPNEEWTITGYTLDNLFNLVYNARNVSGMISGGIPWAPVIVLSSIALFMLALSCVNYMNIALAAAGRRLKEIGMRKVMGSTQRQLVWQFLTENILLCMLSLLTGISLANIFLIPAFNGLADTNLALILSQNLNVVIFLLLLLAGIGLASGAYPAFYISSFQPVSILRGKQKLVSRKRFMHILLTFQFVLAFITIIASVTFISNVRYLNGLDWGYNYEDTIYVRLQAPEEYDILHSAALQLPSVLKASGSGHHIGVRSSQESAEVNGESISIAYFDVDRNYLETVGVRLKSGQFIEDTGSIVINETFAQASGWTEPLGQTVRFYDSVYTVVGVVEDFHYRNFASTIYPALFRLGDASEFRFITLRVKPGTDVETGLALKETWQQLRPETPFEFYFQHEVFGTFFRESVSIANLFTFTGITALLISCMGLFGLASQHIAGRIKEISIRKVLGASVGHVTRLANQRFLLLLVIAALIATPLSYVILDPLLDDIYNQAKIPIGPAPFLIAFALIFTTALLTTATQVYKVLAANPAEVLRNE